jgi:hypothetical protein
MAMVTTLGRPVSQPTLWSSMADAADRAALDPGVHDDLDRRPDVLVVGGGMVGLGTALFCRRAGLGRVLVIEARRLAAGASGGAAGLLVPELQWLGDPPGFVAFARSSLALYRRLDEELEGALGLRRRPTLLVLPDGPPVPPAWGRLSCWPATGSPSSSGISRPCRPPCWHATRRRSTRYASPPRWLAGSPAWGPGWR